VRGWPRSAGQGRPPGTAADSPLDSIWAGLRPVRRWLRRRRRALGAVAAGAAVFTVVSALSPSAPPTVSAVVAAREIPAGSVLQAADLARSELPEALVPAGALADPGAAIGHPVGGAVRPGEVLTDVRLVGGAAGRGPADAASGLAAAPVRLADAEAARLLRAGDLVDVLGATPEGSADVIAEAVRVLSVPRPVEGGGFLAGDGAAGGALVVVEVDRETARALAGAAAAGVLSAALVG
jgi:Flp pilus assembly protein CpaB